MHNIANFQNHTSYQRFLFLRSSLCGNTAPCNLMKCSVHFSRGPLAGLKPGRASQESRNDKVWIRPPDDVPLYPGDGQEGDRRNVLRFSLCWVMDGYCYLDLCCSTINHRKMSSLFDQKNPKLCNQVPSLSLSRWRTLTLLKIYSRLRNKRRGTLINFGAFYQWLRAY